MFKLVFSVFLRISVPPYPFFIYLMTAVFPWQFLGSAVSRSVTSIYENRQLIKESTFPCELIPVAVVCAALINFVPSIAIIYLSLLYFKVAVSAFFFLLPLVIVMHTFFIIGVALIVSSIHVRFRDAQYLTELMIFTFYYLVPVFYPLRLVEQYLSAILFKLYLLNPLIGTLNLYRFCFLQGFLDTLPASVTLFELVVVPLVGTSVIFFSGVYIFRKLKPTFMDHISI
jgi:ABC-type polysaccharide/polyol phosphate export permease